MKNSNAINQKINEYYTHLKNKALSYELLIEKTLLNDKNYLNKVNEIGNLKLDIAKAYYLNNTALENELESKLLVLENEKTSIESHILSKIKKYKYACEQCRDSGFISNKRCSCYYKKVAEFCFDALMLKKVDYPSFNGEIYDENQKFAQKLVKFSKEFPNNKIKNLVFSGKAGTGKTFLAKCIANDVENSNFSVIYLTSTDLNYLFLKMHLGEIDKILVLDILKDCDLLIVDDFGTEPIFNNVTIEYYTDIISYRITNLKHIIITTNLTPNEILNRYNERIYSRLSDKTITAIIPFNGKDLRQKHN